MSEERTARDPFVGLNRLIERRAEETQRSWDAIGKGLSVSPLKIRADGMDLDREDLRVPESLFPNFAPTAQGRGIQAVLPEKVFAEIFWKELSFTRWQLWKPMLPWV